MLSTIIRPDAVVEEIIAGSKFVAVKAGGRMGLSSLLGARPREYEKDLANQMTGKDGKHVAGLIRQPSPYAISLGFAALNAGNAPDPKFVEPSDFPADDLIARLGKDRITGLVGEFPFLKSLKNGWAHFIFLNCGLYRVLFPMINGKACWPGWMFLPSRGPPF